MGIGTSSRVGSIVEVFVLDLEFIRRGVPGNEVAVDIYIVHRRGGDGDGVGVSVVPVELQRKRVTDIRVAKIATDRDRFVLEDRRLVNRQRRNFWHVVNRVDGDGKGLCWGGIITTV